MIEISLATREKSKLRIALAGVSGGGKTLGALLLAGLYALFGDVVMPTLNERITNMFNYAGALE